MRSTASSARLLSVAIATAYLFALPLAAAQSTRPPMPAEALPAEQAAKVPQLDLRATQINHCSDGRNGTVLQDAPCSPAAASAAAEAIEMSALPPRAAAEPAPPAAAQGPSNGLPKWLATLGWKLGAIVLVAFALFRTFLYLRDRRRYREMAVDTKDRPPVRVR